MQAVILAAGQSSRFYPFHSATHKSLIKIMGKTLLEHTLISLKHAGITEIVLVVSPNSPIQQLLGEGKQIGTHITYVIQEETLGMGHALLQTEQYIKDDFFLLHAYHFEVDQFIPNMVKKKRKKEEVVLLGKPLGGTDRYGYMITDGEKVTGIVEKPKEIINNSLHLIGIYLLNKHFLTTLKETPLSHYHFEEALDAYTKTGNVTFLETDKKTITLKYAWDILDMKDYLLDNIEHNVSPKAEVSPHAIISGTVVIEEGAKIFEGACIKGPCYIGKNAVIGNNALVRDKVVAEENSVIGSYMEIKNAVMMQGSTTHTGFIGDSVIGSNSKIGAEICTTNVRLDRQTILPEVKENKVSSYRTHLGVIVGDNAIIGARVTTMPGTIIGNDSFIGPSTVVMKNVADNTKYYTEFKNIEKERK
ncbi:MAG TPA: bifunctional sugar-1-phosphate nucleotidylyltransferase/acetyltransferase [Candidatus Saccharimonadales bacterium]|nr:bifunctional sugar-1-phosphate nucleotidylyltransferase/acetyltransferase [Candidatus Saccharimonadales bacterium]